MDFLHDLSCKYKTPGCLDTCFTVISVRGLKETIVGIDDFKKDSSRVTTAK